MSDLELLQKMLDVLELVNGAETCDGIIIHTDDEIKLIKKHLSKHELNYPALVEQLRNIVNVQGQRGTYNDGNYMLGLFNGLEFALSIFDRREPKFRGKDSLFISDYRIVATNENGKIKWVVDDWPQNCTLYMKNYTKDVPDFDAVTSE